MTNNRATSISQRGLDLIKEFEGLRLETYKDSVGIPTIGYGHTGKDVVEGRKISIEDAEKLLKRDCQWAENAINAVVKVDVNQNQFDALCSFIYNLGASKFEKSTLCLKLNLSDYKGAAEEFLKWDKAGGQVLPGLTRRRKKEREMFLS